MVSHSITECFLEAEAEADVSSNKVKTRQFRELRTFTPCYHGATETEKAEKAGSYERSQRHEFSRRMKEKRYCQS